MQCNSTQAATIRDLMDYIMTTPYLSELPLEDHSLKVLELNKGDADVVSE